MEQGGDQVRVMTVHGAKGLEANIVILPDTCDIPERRKDPGILTTLVEHSGGLLSVPLWRVKSDKDARTDRRPARPGARERAGRIRAAAATSQ